jgi:hypothetical protein
MWSDNESREDLLGFQYLAGAVVSIVKNENVLPATIGVFGDWGGGKSTLIEIVRMTETDGPFVQDGAEPATPTTVKTTVRSLAELWEQSPGDVQAATLDNFRMLLAT